MHKSSPLSSYLFARLLVALFITTSLVRGSMLALPTQPTQLGQSGNPGPLILMKCRLKTSEKARTWPALPLEPLLEQFVMESWYSGEPLAAKVNKNNLVENKRSIYFFEVESSLLHVITLALDGCITENNSFFIQVVPQKRSNGLEWNHHVIAPYDPTRFAVDFKMGSYLSGNPSKLVAVQAEQGFHFHFVIRHPANMHCFVGSYRYDHIAYRKWLPLSKPLLCSPKSGSPRRSEGEQPRRLLTPDRAEECKKMVKVKGEVGNRSLLPKQRSDRARIIRSQPFPSLTSPGIKKTRARDVKGIKSVKEAQKKQPGKAPISSLARPKPKQQQKKVNAPQGGTTLCKRSPQQRSKASVQCNQPQQRKPPQSKRPKPKKSSSSPQKKKRSPSSGAPPKVKRKVRGKQRSVKLRKGSKVRRQRVHHRKKTHKKPHKKEGKQRSKRDLPGVVVWQEDTSIQKKRLLKQFTALLDRIHESTRKLDLARKKEMEGTHSIIQQHENFNHFFMVQSTYIQDVVSLVQRFLEVKKVAMRYWLLKKNPACRVIVSVCANVYGHMKMHEDQGIPLPSIPVKSGSLRLLLEDFYQHHKAYGLPMPLHFMKVATHVEYPKAYNYYAGRLLQEGLTQGWGLG